MNRATLILVGLAFAALIASTIGCGTKANRTTKTNPPATPVNAGGGGTTPGQTASSALRVVVPERVELALGGSQTIEVSVDRSGGFASEVKFSLRPPMSREVRGVTFTPADWQVNSTESGTKIVAAASAEATPGTYTWTLIARPRVGQESTQSFTVIVR